MSRNCNYRFLSHAIDKDVGPAIAQDAAVHGVLPVVVVGEAAHGGLDAAEHYGHVGVEALEYLGVYDGGVLGTQVVTPVGGVGILGAQALAGSVLVDHRVHAPGSDTEEETRTAHLAEVAQVVTPIGLRHDGHTQTLGFEDAPYHGSTERGVVYIGIA